LDISSAPKKQVLLMHPLVQLSNSWVSHCFSPLPANEADGVKPIIRG
jgi:hypothetical protein